MQSNLVGKSKKSEKAGSASIYLRKNLKNVLPRALHEVCLTRPADPIEFLAKCLYKAADSDLYFQDKAVFEREKHKMEVKLKTEDTKRQNALERYKKHIFELQACIQKEEAAKRVSIRAVSPKQALPVRKPRSHSRAGFSKNEIRRKTLFDSSYTEHSGKSSASLQSETQSSESSPMDIPTPPELKMKRLPSVVATPQVTRKGTAPSADSRTVVSLRRDSSSGSYDALERSPSMLTSSSKTVSRLFSLSQEGEDGLKGSSETGTQSLKSQQSRKKPPERQPHVPRPRKKKSKTDDSLSDVSGSYKSGDLKDKKSHGVPDAITSKSQMQRRESTQQIKKKKEKTGKSKGAVREVSKRKQVEDSHKYEELEDVSGIDLEVTSPEDYTHEELLQEEGEMAQQPVPGDEKRSSLTSMTSDKQMMKFEVEEGEELSLEEQEVQSTISELETLSTEDETAVTTRKKYSKTETGDETFEEDVQDEASSGRKRKSKKLKGQRKASRRRSSFDVEEEEKPRQDDEESKQRDGRLSRVQIIYKKKKKKRGGKYSENTADDDDTEYADEKRIFVGGRSSSSTKRASVLKQTEAESQEEEEEIATAVRRRGRRRSSVNLKEDDDKRKTRKLDRRKSSSKSLEEDEKHMKPKRKKKGRPSITIDVADDEGAMGLDGERSRRSSQGHAGSTTDSLEPRRRARRRVKKHDAKSTEDEMESPGEQDKLSPLPSQLPSSESSTEDFHRGVNVAKSGAKKKPAAGHRRFSSRKSVSEGSKGSRKRDKKSRHGSFRTSMEESESEISVHEHSLGSMILDHLGIESTSSAVQVSQEETFPFTPVECEWFLVGTQTLVCRHPVLGDIRSRPVIATQSFYGWPDRLNYNWRAFYDPEVYTVVEPFATDTKYRRRPKDF